MKKPIISIIGAGPAGIAASIQLKRFGYEPFLIEKSKIGGLLWNANLIENYPGFPKGISGPDLINLMINQLSCFDIEVKKTRIDQLTQTGSDYQLTAGPKKFSSDYVIIASGTKPKPIQVKIEEDARDSIHQDISYILDVRGKHIVIIGSGDAAFDQAINLSKKNKVSILNRGENLNSLKLLVERAFENKRIRYMSNAEVISINLKYSHFSGAERILIVNYKNDKNSHDAIECDEVVFAIGREPQLDFIDHLVEHDTCMLAGDVKNGIYRQATIAIGDGVKAAMKIHNQIIKRFQ